MPNEKINKTVLAPSPSEDEIHLSCAQWVTWNLGRYPILEWIMHVPNGGKRSKAEAGRFKAMGVKKGVPDWILPFSSPSGKWTGFACELKSKAGKLSDDQVNWLKNAKTNGWKVCVARSLEEFIFQIEVYLSK